MTLGAQKRKLAAALRRGRSEESNSVADVLDNCSGRSGCGMAACPVCHARWKAELSESLERFLSAFRQVWMTTIILPNRDLRQQNLSDVDPRMVVQQARMLLRRHGLADRPIVGVLEADWHETDGVWEPHLHLLIGGEKPDFESLKAALRMRRGEVHRPVQTKEVDGLPGIIRYILKMTAKRKLRFRQGRTSRSYRYSLRGRKLRASLRWYGRPPAHFLFLQGLRVAGSELRLLI